MKLLLLSVLFVASQASNRCEQYGGRCLGINEPCDNVQQYMSKFACPGFEDGEWQCCKHQPGEDDDCGNTDFPADAGYRIQPGHESQPGSWPWVATLKLKAGKRHCGATIIDDRWLLTAAHCVMEKTGPHNVLKPRNPEIFEITVGDNQESEKVYTVEALYPHERHAFSRLSVLHDIALIKLRDRLEFSQHVRKICLPKLRNYKTYFNDKQCWITGRGDYESTADRASLQQSAVTILKQWECRDRGWDPERMLSYTKVCADTNDTTACAGDVGGGLMCRDGKHFYLLGVNSFGNTFCHALPTVYTRVNIYLGWMYEIMTQGRSSLPG